MSSIHSTLKSILLLLAILGAYGVVGQMDYDDAIRMENAQKQVRPLDCDRAVSDSSQRAVRPLPNGQPVRSGEPKVSAGNCKSLDF
jgi:hypothetical protein